MQTDIKIVQNGMSEGFTGQKIDFSGEDKWAPLYEALQAKHNLQVYVDGVEGNNLVVFIGDAKGIILAEEFGDHRPKKLQVLIGAPIVCRIKHIDRKNNMVYLSRKEAVAEMASATWQELKKLCKPLVEIQEEMKEVRNGVADPTKLTDEQKNRLRQLGAAAREGAPVRTATVRSVFPGGAFVDIGGVAAFLPVHEMSWGQVTDARELDAIRPGNSFDVKVIRVDFDSRWVRVSLKAMLPDPWDRVPGRYLKKGEYGAKVVRVTANGRLVVELEPGVTTVCNPLPMGQRLSPGQPVRVQITDIRPERKWISARISGLSPWSN